MTVSSFLRISTVVNKHFFQTASIQGRRIKDRCYVGSSRRTMARRGALAAALFGVLGMNTTRERYLSDVALADLGKTWTQVDPLPPGRSAFGVAVIDARRK